MAQLAGPGLDTVLEDLRQEGADLDGLLAALPAAGWATATPAPGWTVAHQIAHLAWTDEQSHLAASDPAAFAEQVSAATADPMGFVERGAARGAQLEPAELLRWWREARARLRAALAATGEDTRIPWFGPPMRPMSMATARIMETWAHGQDIADALGATRVPTARLRHVAHIGVRTRDYAYHANELEPPSEPIRVELSGPGGEAWTWGPDDATERVWGSALDFCLVVTQRRHREDTELHTAGARAGEWLALAQAFAGPPGPGRAAGQFG